MLFRVFYNYQMLIIYNIKSSIWFLTRLVFVLNRDTVLFNCDCEADVMPIHLRMTAQRIKTKPNSKSAFKVSRYKENFVKTLYVSIATNENNAKEKANKVAIKIRKTRRRRTKAMKEVYRRETRIRSKLGTSTAMVLEEDEKLVC